MNVDGIVQDARSVSCTYLYILKRDWTLAVELFHNNLSCECVDVVFIE